VVIPSGSTSAEGITYGSEHAGRWIKRDLVTWHSECSSQGTHCPFPPPSTRNSCMI